MFLADYFIATSEVSVAGWEVLFVRFSCGEFGRVGMYMVNPEGIGRYGK